MKRYTVFVSSTFEDLQEERHIVAQSLLRLNMIPCGMELFPASSKEQWSLMKKEIEQCDYFLLIIAGMYGSEDSRGMGYTEKEYRFALKQKKPALVFLYKDIEELPVKKVEHTDKQREKLISLRNFALKKKHVRFWSSPHELGECVAESIPNLINEFPSTGWIRPDAPELCGVSAVHPARQFANQILYDHPF